MPILTKRQKNHVAKTIRTKRRILFGYPGGNRLLAEKVGVSEQLVSMWACNKRVPKNRELLLLAKIFGISLDALCPAGGGCARDASVSEKRGAPASVGDARKSMLEICDITTQLVKRQKQMLNGKRQFGQHREWLKRIKNYVDAL